MSQELFTIRDRANEGVRLTLQTPDGEDTDHWLQVRHTWSDAFEIASEVEAARLQDAVLAAKGDKAKIAAAKLDSKYRIMAALVSGWSFEEECTPEAVEAFLRAAPQLCDKLDRFAVDSKAFFGNGSTS